MTVPYDDSAEQTAAHDVMGEGVAHLAALARAPRGAGSAAEHDAREYCAKVLRTAGFDVGLESFEYSQLPGRYGTLVGGAIAWIAIAATSWLGATGAPSSLWPSSSASVSRRSACGRGASRSGTAC